MGAIPHEEGTLFRVWAPHADSVFVMGTFNDWSCEAHPLAEEGSGYWSADVAEAEAGHEYKLAIQRGKETFIKNDPYARLMVHSSDNAIIYDAGTFDWEGDAFQMPPWNELVLYEMHVGTFAVKRTDEGPGTFKSAIQRLDYLCDLGINAVELMPLAEFAGDYSWGYNPAHPYAVEEAYGGPDAFKAFVKEAHARGIAVLLDVVYNHFGPSDLDLWRFDGWSEDGYGGVYFYNDDRASTPWGQTRPDYGRPEVRQYIRDNVLMWLEDFRLDGLRWDGTVFIRRTDFSGGTDLPDGWQLMQDVLREVQEERPGALMIAEDLQTDGALTAPPEEGGAGFGAQWDAAFVHPVREALITPHDEARNVEAVRDAYLHSYHGEAFQRVVYVESHDEVANGRARLMHEIDSGDSASWAGKKRSTLGAALVLTAPGIPMLFQGQEFLEDAWFRDTVPLEWDRVERHDGIHALYRDLIALRRNGAGVTRGLTGPNAECIHMNSDAKVLAFHRWVDGGPADSVVAVFNLSTTTHESYRLGFPAAGTWRLHLNSDWSGYDDSFGGQTAYDVNAGPDAHGDLPASATVALGPYSALLLSQDTP